MSLKRDIPTLKPLACVIGTLAALHVLPARAAIEEVIVTAQKREESIQSVPIAITAISGDVLQQAGVSRSDDLKLITPNLEIFPAFTQNSANVQMRGQTQIDSAAITVDPSVGIYYDDVYIGRSPGSLMSMMDMERVEVLKGPQGTIYGRNTTGGAIKLISNKPIDLFEASLRAAYEPEGDRTKITGMINLPLGDISALRVAGQWDDLREGYSENSVTGKDLDTNETKFVRASWLISPADDLEVLIQGDLTNSNGGGLATRLKEFRLADGAGAQGAVAETALENGLDPATQFLQAYRLICSWTDKGCPATGAFPSFPGGAMDPYRPATDMAIANATNASYVQVAPGVYFPVFSGGRRDPFFSSDTSGLSGTVSYDLDDVTLKSVTAYREMRQSANFEIDGTAINLIDSLQDTRQRQFSQEFLATGSSLDGLLAWTAGAQYFREKANDNGLTRSFSIVSFISSPLPPDRRPVGNNTLANTDNESWSVFGQGTYDLTDALALTLGARYSNDKRSRTANSVTQLPNGQEVCSMVGATGTTLNPCDLTNEKTFNAVTWTAALDYKLTEDKMVYGKVSRGYRGGGFNARVSVPETANSFDPEYITEWEGGFKGDWLDRTLRTNFALFFDNYTDIQQTFNGLTNGVTWTSTANLGKAHIYGFEADITASPTDWLTVIGTLGLIDSKLDSVKPYDEMPMTADTTSSLAVVVDRELMPGVLDGLFRIDYSYRAPMFESNVVANEKIWYGTREVVNARFQLTHIPSGLELSLYGTNLLDKEYDSRVVGVSGTGIVFANIAPPRVLGLEVAMPFGAAKR